MAAVTQIGLGFLEGLALFLSPCILPVLPIVLSAGINGSRVRPVAIIIGFVLAFSTITLFSREVVLALGIAPDWIRWGSFALLFLFGLVLLSTRLSEGFARLTQPLGQVGTTANQKMTLSNDALTGLAVGACIGLVWVPCSGPILAAVLVQSILQQTTLAGDLTVLAFALGAGLPMFALALGGNQLMQQLTFFKRHAERIRKATGALLILTVLLTAQNGLFPALSQAKPAQAPMANSKLIDGLSRPYPAPPIVGIDTWVNTPPLTPADLKGKVVLVDFWTYSCINCVRTLPHMKALDAKYRKDGLVIIGVHAPEFEFERNANNVRRAVQQQGIAYPVALDNNLRTWRSFNNQYWPAHYLIDRSGKVVYTHFGEGEYDITERNIRTLLGLKGDAGPASLERSPVSILQSPETYLGSDRAEALSSPQAVQINRPVSYSYPGFLPLHHWALNGSWKVSGESIQANSATAGLRMNFYAKNVYLVLGTADGKPIPVKVSVNGQAIGKPIVVDHHTLYTLVSLKTPQNGLLEIQSTRPGLQAYAFTFGS